MRNGDYCGSVAAGAVGFTAFGTGIPGGAVGVPGGTTGVGTPGICPRFPPSIGFQMNSHSK